MTNKYLNKAKKDEFYTKYSDIEKELIHYAEQLRNKVIFCNCDDARKSNFGELLGTKVPELPVSTPVAKLDLVLHQLRRLVFP